VSTIYISGPISLGGTCSAAEIEAFTQRFRDETTRLRNLGHRVIDPTEVPKQNTWEDYMRFALRAVSVADVVGVLPRWEESRGARLEVFLARELRIPVVEASAL